MLNPLKKKPIAIRTDTLENLVKDVADVISQNNEETHIHVQELIALIFKGQARTTALINVISEKLGFNETEIINKADELVESNWGRIEQEIKEYCDMAKQINDIFDK